MQYSKLLVFFLPIALSSCYDGDQLVDYDYRNGDIATFVPDLSTPKDSVEFYVDDEKVATEYELPFVLNYKIQDMTSGKHKLTIKGYYTVHNSNNNSHSWYTDTRISTSWFTVE